MLTPFVILFNLGQEKTCVRVCVFCIFKVSPYLLHIVYFVLLVLHREVL